VDESKEWLTQEQLGERLRSYIPGNADADQVIAGVLLALRPPEEQTRPIEGDLFHKDVVYAWHESDASVTKMALEVLGELGEAFLEGPIGIKNLGFALKELVCFLIKLYRHRVRVSDPVEVSVLLLLQEARSGLTSKGIRQRLVDANGGDIAPSLSEVDNALDRLANAVASTGSKPLVRADGQIWKSLV